MWRNRDEDNCIEEEKILGLVNDELQKYNRPKMSKEELERILKDLERMECIEKIDDENKWWLREWIKTSYEWVLQGHLTAAIWLRRFVPSPRS